MDSPVILVVDGEAATRRALVDALERRFGRDYRVSGLAEPARALADLARLRDARVPVALIIADHWLPAMRGDEVLARAHELHPGAQRLLLVARGDRGAAPAILQGCAFGRLDNYLYRPWEPAEVHLYPLVTEYLAEWTREHGPRLELVRVVGASPSPRAHQLRDLLERKGVPHGFYRADTPAGARLLQEAGRPGARLPAVLLLDGRVLEAPTNAELSDALGETDLAEPACDLVIVGAGPAGLAAAVYAASEGLRTVVVEREAVGGQAGTSTLIRNYLGFPRGISGAELAQRAYQQAWLFGAQYVFARGATRLEARGRERRVVLEDGRSLAARAVLIATGATWRRIGNPRLERFSGAGLYYTAMGDTRVMSGRQAWVVGGGNSAGQAAVWLARNAKRVTLLVRGESVSANMSDYLVQQIRRLPNVEVREGVEVVDGDGDHALERIVLRDRRRGTTTTVPAELLFVLIGAVPHTEWLDGAVRRDPDGFVLTGRDLDDEQGPRLQYETSLPGVFAAGDVRFGSVKRVASAVGEGSVSVRFVHEYLTPAAERPRPPEAARAPRTTPAAPAPRLDGTV